MDHRRRKVGARRSSRIALVGMVAALAVAGAVGVQPPAFASTVTVSLAPAGASSAPQGSPFFFKATLQNVGPSSQTVTVVFELIDQTASSVQFSSWTGTIAAGATKTVNGRVISSQFFAPLGTYLIQALDGQVPSGSPLSYTVTAAPVTVPTFQDVTSASGLATTLPATSICPEEAVIGAAWADVNGDGYLDLFQPVPLGPSQLWINDGTGHFTDQATSRGVDDLGRIAVGTTFADYDNDGDPDLYVVNNGPNQLFQNDGAGHFTDVTLTSGVGDAGVGPSAAWGDFNNDGHLDLFVANHAQCAVNQSDTLYMNNGDGTFANVTSYLLSGGPGLGDGFAAAWFDYNGDGRQDLYIANDDLGNLPNQLFRNDGPGPLGTWTFTDVSTQSHANYLVASMGIAVGDYNRDMKLDFAVSNIGGNVLAKNNGNGTFTNVAAAAGAKRATESDGVNAVTWGMGFYDLNLDGWEDLFVTDGGTSDEPQNDQLFVNSGSKGRFFDLSMPSGASDPGSGRGVAFADYDRDGRMDLYVVNMNGSPHLYHNVTPLGSAHWLEVRPVGTVSNRDGCGARLVATVAGHTMMREVFCGSTSAASGSDPYVHFGLGTATSVSQLEIDWPSGTKQILTNVAADQAMTVTEGAS